MLSFSISYSDLSKLPYFGDLTQKGDKEWTEAQKQGEDKMALRKILVFSQA